MNEITKEINNTNTNTSEIKKRNPRVERILTRSFANLKNDKFGEKYKLDADSMVEEDRKFNIHIANKLKDRCFSEIENIKKYSIIKPKYKQLNTNISNNIKEFEYEPIIGKAKEFKNSFEEFNKCKAPYEDLKATTENLKDFNLSNFQNSLNFCINDCEELLFEINVTDSKLEKCFNKCIKYSKYNFLAGNFLMKEKYDFDIETMNKNFEIDKSI